MVKLSLTLRQEISPAFKGNTAKEWYGQRRTSGNTNLHEKVAHLWTPKIMLNLNSILYIIKYIFYCIFHSLFCSVSFAPAILALFSFLQVFSSHNYSLVSKHWFLLIILLTMPFPSFTVVVSSTSHDLCFSSGLFIFFCFSNSSSFPSAFSHRLLSVISFPLCGILFIYLI